MIHNYYWIVFVTTCLQNQQNHNLENIALGGGYQPNALPFLYTTPCCPNRDICTIALALALASPREPGGRASPLVGGSHYGHRSELAKDTGAW
jgi:hypothetical protein